MPAGSALCPPQLSLLMVVRNGAAHIDAAIASARRQSLTELEILVVDDGSTDATCAIVRRHAAEDARVRLEPGPRQGLAAVRNRSLELARAPWAAILDSDDILHPHHARNLLDLARRSGASLVAANMIAFDADNAALFASGSDWSAERTIELAPFVEAGRLDRAGVSLGYLKPLFRRDALAAHGLRYDARLRIGEDYDLIERTLAKGLAYAFSPEPTYFYRRHSGSTSFRLGCEDLRALIAAEDERPCAAPGTPLAEARAARRHSLVAALAHAEAVADIKAGRIASGCARLLRDPAAARLMVRSAREGLTRRIGFPARDRASARWAAVLCGAPLPGSRIERAARLLAGQGCDLRWIEDARCADPLVLAQAGRGASLVLVADEDQCDPAAFVIADRAPVIGDGSFCHPLIDSVLPARPAELLRFAVAADVDAPRSRAQAEVAA
ncbi:glycosyltransferase family A protein [Erythrobacter sp.]|uniref:glycosyltransferase family 2 protein n=1 Tax=Erythrobacter sp. TaxID=1042 RepID=UPI0025FC52EE|nr:glycosyltransferase family A protein [Erythrobacter sp.]